MMLSSLRYHSLASRAYQGKLYWCQLFTGPDNMMANFKGGPGTQTYITWKQSLPLSVTDRPGNWKQFDGIVFPGEFTLLAILTRIYSSQEPSQYL